MLSQANQVVQANWETEVGVSQIYGLPELLIKFEGSLGNIVRFSLKIQKLKENWRCSCQSAYTAYTRPRFNC